MRWKGRPARNWLAVRAHMRTGAGTHGDARKEASRTMCRGKDEVERELEVSVLEIIEADAGGAHDDDQTDPAADPDDP